MPCHGARLNFLALFLITLIRVRTVDADHKIGDGRKSLAASIIFAHLQIGESQTISGKRWVWGRLVYVSAKRLDDGE